MTYPENFEQKTGFDRIRLLLKGRCMSELGRSLVDEISFSSSYDAVSAELDLVEEMREILLFGEGFPSQDYFDLRREIRQLSAKGSWMDVEQLGELRAVLRTIDGILHFLLHNDEPAFPGLARLAVVIALPEDVLAELNRILDDAGQLRDNASPRLLTIRNSLRKLQASVASEVARMMRLAKQSGWVPDDTDITVRNGRLVIPVHSSAKRKIDGLVHDRSATGQTLYIEPREIFEANNEIRELELEELEEIRRILMAVADQIRPHLASLYDAFAFLARIDFIRSKARLALELDAHKPLLDPEPGLEWFDAIHPLLYLSHKAQKKKVVPLRVKLDASSRILVISGPNAGGKSVALKTIGLLQYMLQCGLTVPLRPTSVCGIFDDIMLDIGDEQSIENDLSTYSSHLLHMKHFLDQCGPRSLFLIDEFGSGTEPRFGGALAEAILEGLYHKGSYGVVTTHYANLKTLPENFEGIINGAMQFDVENMAPLFLLETGRPGSSFAYEIAHRIGLPEDILSAAEQKAGTELIALDRQLQQLANDQRDVSQKQTQLKVADDFLAEMIDKYEKLHKELEQKKKEILAGAKLEAKGILDQSNRLIETTIREIRESQADKEKTREARERLEREKLESESESESENSKARRSPFEGGFRGMSGQNIESSKDSKARKSPFEGGFRGMSDKGTGNQNSKDKKSPFEGGFRGMSGRNSQNSGNSGNSQNSGNSGNSGNSDELDFIVGDTVRMEGQVTVGDIISIKGSVAEVLFGSMRLKLPLDRLVRAQGNTGKVGRSGQSDIRNIMSAVNDKMASFSPQIDLRGVRAEESLHLLEAYIDDAILLNVPDVRILHGKGSGVLRHVVREYLATVKEVKRFADEQVERGGYGITVVSFRE